MNDAIANKRRRQFTRAYSQDAPLLVVVSRGMMVVSSRLTMSRLMRLHLRFQQMVLHWKKALKMRDFGIEAPTAMFGQITTGDEMEN